MLEKQGQEENRTKCISSDSTPVIPGFVVVVDDAGVDGCKGS